MRQPHFYPAASLGVLSSRRVSTPSKPACASAPRPASVSFTARVRPMRAIQARLTSACVGAVPEVQPALSCRSVDIGGPGLGGADYLGDEPPRSQDPLDEIALLDVLGAGDDLAAGSA